MKILHLVKVIFDRRTSAITNEWLNTRYEFFRQYTRKSLEGQRFKDFQLWTSCGVNMSWSDAMLAKEKTVADFVTCGIEHEPDELLRNAAKDYDYVYVTRVDSDDLLAPDAVKLANECWPYEMGRTEASVFKRGYMHDLTTGETRVYVNHSSPFHTLMIPREVFCDSKKYAALNYGDHSKVYSTFPTQTLNDWRFCVLVHKRNFISTIDYANEPGTTVEKNWSVERFLQQPVTFDIDDFCDKWDCLGELHRLKQNYPDFKCTLFTIPRKTDIELLHAVKDLPWIEIAYHGLTHVPNEELKFLSPRDFRNQLTEFIAGGLRSSHYVRGFRPPGWYITAQHIAELNSLGMWVALHLRDESQLGPKCAYGYYVCNYKPYWHGHTHDVCGNGIRENLTKLLEMWPKDQKFQFVSEAIVVPQRTRT